PRALKAQSGVDVEDIAKRLMDYGFHAPTISFPVAGTLMIEPTESESKAELDRVVAALVAIRAEIAGIASGALPPDDNPPQRAAPPALGAPPRADGARPPPGGRPRSPLPGVGGRKFWPAGGGVDTPSGARPLVCSCPPVEEYASV